jgi:hypothetical protein
MAREKELSTWLDTSTPLLDDVNVVRVVFNLISMKTRNFTNMEED